MQYSLLQIKKELQTLESKELSEICLRLAKYKKDNKELLAYLLFDADDPVLYADQVKQSLQDDFKTLQKHYYQSTKSLRKIVRTINRHARYTASKQAEIELLLWFCKNFLIYADTRSSHKPLQSLFTRQLEKALKILPKLHEDLQFDYSREFEELLNEARARLRDFSRRDFTP